MPHFEVSITVALRDKEAVINSIHEHQGFFPGKIHYEYNEISNTLLLKVSVSHIALLFDIGYVAGKNVPK